MGKKKGPLKNTVITIGVSDIDAALGKIGKLGGKTIQKKQPVGEMGFTAYLQDTKGTWWVSGRTLEGSARVAPKYV